MGLLIHILQFFTLLTGLATDAHARSCQSYLQPTVAVVAGYSSGRHLKEEFRREGARVIHIHPASEIEDPYMARTFSNQGYDGEYFFDAKDPAGFEKLVGSLAANGDVPAIALPGSDSGGRLSDRLGHHFGLSQVNDFALMEARWDKFLMGQRLKHQRVPHAYQMRTRRLENAQAFAARYADFNAGIPIVLKPLKKNGTTDVFIAYSEAEVEHAFKTILAHDPDGYVLVQEFLDGPEFALDVTSADGFHKVDDVLLYDREILRGAATLYRRDRLLDFRRGLLGYSPEFIRQMTEYAFRVLDALGVRWGNSHLEIKFTRRGFILVEMSPRLIGANLPPLIAEATGHSQLDRAAMAYLRPDEFKKLSPGYDLKKHLAMVFIKSEGDGGRMSYDIKPTVEAIPGVRWVTPNFPDDQILERSINADTIPWDIAICDDSLDVVERAAAELFRLEKARAFERR